MTLPPANGAQAASGIQGSSGTGPARLRGLLATVMEGSRNRRTRRNGILGGLALVVVLGGFFFGKSYLEERARQEHAAREAAVEATAQQVSDKLQQAIRPPLEKVEALANDPSIQSIFASGDQAVLQQAAAKRGQDIKHLLKLRFLLPGEIRQQPDARPPLSFASLDLLKRARTSQAPTDVELHMPGSENAHIVMVRRVLADNGELLGLVHASLSPELLKQALQDLDGVDGYLELKQFVGGGNPVVLVQRGDAGNKTGAFSKTVPIDATSWALTYWPASATATSTGIGYGWVQPIVALLVIVLILVGGLRLSAFYTVPRQHRLRRCREGVHGGRASGTGQSGTVSARQAAQAAGGGTGAAGRG